MRLNTQISLPKFWDYEMDFCVALSVSTEVFTSENKDFSGHVSFDFNLNKSIMSASVWECVWECVRECVRVYESVCVRERVRECVVVLLFVLLFYVYERAENIKSLRKQK